MEYLGIRTKKPRVGVFDFTGCEGCELQLANNEETLVDFLSAIELVEFREVASERSDEYDVALVEGAVTRADELERLRAIRDRAAIVVALGSCACFGGVNRLKNAFDLAEVNREVYGDKPRQTQETRAIGEVIEVDLMVPGCPVSKAEVERIVQHLVLDVPFSFPAYPVCGECKQRFTVCLVQKGRLCLGPITRAGCNAPCPAGGLGCWGCRGPAEEVNMEGFLAAARELGFDDEEVRERLDMFGGFEGVR
jgi:coenzyme F420-reducing hydrogenase gamma subunit